MEFFWDWFLVAFLLWPTWESFLRWNGRFGGRCAAWRTEAAKCQLPRGRTIQVARRYGEIVGCLPSLKVGKNIWIMNKWHPKRRNLSSNYQFFRCYVSLRECRYMFLQDFVLVVVFFMFFVSTFYISFVYPEFCDTDKEILMMVSRKALLPTPIGTPTVLQLDSCVAISVIQASTKILWIWCRTVTLRGTRCVDARLADRIAREKGLNVTCIAGGRVNGSTLLIPWFFWFKTKALKGRGGWNNLVTY